MADTRIVIHPNVNGPTHAESPFARKLKRIRDDVAMAQSIAPVDSGAELELIIAALDALIEGK